MTTKNTPITVPQLANFTSRKGTGLADTLGEAVPESLTAWMTRYLIFAIVGVRSPPSPKGRIARVQGKGNTERTVFLSNDARLALADWSFPLPWSLSCDGRDAIERRFVSLLGYLPTSPPSVFSPRPPVARRSTRSCTGLRKSRGRIVSHDSCDAPVPYLGVCAILVFRCAMGDVRRRAADGEGGVR